MKPFILLLLALVTLSPLYPQNESPKPIIFITDASGSMWQKVNDEYKIVLARQVLGDLVGEMADNQPIGLVAYGHRRKSDCADIETLLPLGNTDKAAFQQALEALNPTGMTPLAQSARQVIHTLRDQQQAATVILITDGLETCEGDLCEIVREAKAAGVDFVLHIVGFDLGESDKSALECAARESGGKYIDASDREELAEALQESSEWTVDVPTGNVSVKCLRNGELIDCTVYAYPPGAAKATAQARTYASPETNPALMPVPSGTYDFKATVVAQQGIPPMTLQQVQVAEDHLQPLVFDFTSGQVSLTVTSLGELHDAVVRVRPHGENTQATIGRTYTSTNFNPFQKELVPGWYDIEVGSVTIKGHGAKILMEKVEIQAGETTVLTHAFEQATLTVGATNAGGLQDATISIRDKAHNQSVAQGRTYTSASSNPQSFLLSPGTYEVTVKALKYSGQATQTFTVTLKSGESSTQTAAY